MVKLIKTILSDIELLEQQNILQNLLVKEFSTPQNIYFLERLMLAVQNYLLTGHTLKSLNEEFGISSTLSEKLVILNYCQIDSKKFKTHPIVRECRGLTLKLQDYSIAAKAFDRFFNYGECPEIDSQFNFSNFSTQEKADGSLIKVFYYNDSWQLNTRNSFGLGIINGSNHTWTSLFLPFFKNLDKIPKNYTLVAEGCSVFNKVVRHYPNPVVYLLSVFDNNTGLELPEECINDIASLLELPRPTQYHFSSVEDIKSYLGGLEGDPTFEGFVCKDDEGNRFKLKSFLYLNLHRMAGNGNLHLIKNILPIVMAGEVDEVLLYWNELRPDFEKVSKLVEEIRSRLELTWAKTCDIVSQKEFALAIKGEPLSSILFQARKYGDFKRAFQEGEKVLLKFLEDLE